MERLCVEWLPIEGAQGTPIAIQRALMGNIVSWACASPLICALLFMPNLPIATGLIMALCASGLCFLVAGILAQTRAIKLCATALLLTLSVIFILIVMSTGGINSVTALVLVLPFYETLKLSRKYLYPANVLISLMAVIVLTTFSMIALDLSQMTSMSESLADAPEPSALFWLNCFIVAFICGVYAGVRIYSSDHEIERQLHEYHAPNNGLLEIETSELNIAPQILEAMPGLITQHNATGDVLSVHGTNKNILGQHNIQLSGSGLLKHIHVADRIKYLSAIDELRQTMPVHPIELRFEISQGFQPVAQFLHLEAHFIPQYDQKRELLGFYIQFQSLKAPSEIEHENPDDAAQECEVELAKTRFLAGVSHELRTPLNSIMGFSDILLHEIAGPLPNARTRSYVENIRQSSEHLLSVVNTMLDMSKIQNGHYTLQKDSFDITTLLSRVEDMLQIQAGRKDITLFFSKHDHLSHVHADMRALMQILINLVGNAIKFTDHGGKVTLDASIRHTELVLRISDTGIGIAQDKLAELGQPFMQLSSDLGRNYEGTGLGLALVKGLVTLHEGTFDVKSKLGHGTEVTVSIPQASDLHREKRDALSSALTSIDEKSNEQQLGSNRGRAHVA